MIKTKGIQLVTDIMGTKIKTREEEVGVVQNVMIDPQTGSIVYIILCCANFIGDTNRHFAVPHSCLNLREQGSSYYFEVDEEKLLTASGIVIPKTQQDKECMYELVQGATEFIPKYLN